MPLQATDVNAGNANGYEFAANNVTYVIKQGVAVQSDLAGVSCAATYTGARVVNGGLIGAGTGMRLAGDSVHAVNNATGEIVAAECMSVTADSSTLANHGAMSGSVRGIIVSSAASRTNILNTGSISAIYGIEAQNSYEVFIANSGTVICDGNFYPVLVSNGAYVTLTNSGTLTGGFVSLTGTASCRMTNSGVVNGSVSLTGASCAFDGTGGTVTGTVSGGSGGDFLKGGDNGARLSGNSGVDTLTGGKGDDTLSGGDGADTMTGGLGNDIFYVDNALDAVVEVSGEGADTLFAYASFNLSEEHSIEFLRVAPSTGATLLTGNSLNQLVSGGTGSDILNGAGGADELYGKGGNDAFTFTTAPDGTNVDRIYDFANASGNNDFLQLDNDVFTDLQAAAGALVAAKFTANITGEATATNQRIVYETDTGKLFYDADGSGAGASVQFALIANRAALTAADFVVI